jgi:putative ABC transport system substrate-binding protein
MRRRDFITLLGGATAAWPLTARAQRPAIPLVGYLSVGSPFSAANPVPGLREGLRETGLIEGSNVAIEYRWAEGKDDRLPVLAADLVRRQVAVMMTASTAATLAAKQASSAIPIVFAIGGDPVDFGLADSLNRPGRNATGINVLSIELEAKRIGLMHELTPVTDAIAVLVNPANPNAGIQSKEVQEAARALARRIVVLNASNAQQIEAAFATLAQQRVGALVITGDVFLISQRSLFVTSATRLALPAMYPDRRYADEGGLISYGDRRSDSVRQAGVYIGRILKGEKPADLPILQPTKFELVINLKTAKALGLTIPPSLLAIADEVIE